MSDATYKTTASVWSLGYSVCSCVAVLLRRSSVADLLQLDSPYYFTPWLVISNSQLDVTMELYANFNVIQYGCARSFPSYLFSSELHGFSNYCNPMIPAVVISKTVCRHHRSPANRVLLYYIPLFLR